VPPPPHPTRFIEGPYCSVVLVMCWRFQLVGGKGGGLTGMLTVSAVKLQGAFTPLSLFSMESIVADADVFLQFKESKKQYSRIWSQFPDFVPEHDF
jgi:hypothetical protein